MRRLVLVDWWRCAAHNYLMRLWSLLFSLLANTVCRCMQGNLAHPLLCYHVIFTVLRYHTKTAPSSTQTPQAA